MMVTRFWAVVLGTEESELPDVAFETTTLGLGRQFLGGLKPEDLIGIYVGPEAEQEAKAHGLDILKAWDCVRRVRVLESPCPLGWSSQEECFTVRERSIAGTDKPIPECPVCSVTG